MWGGGESGGEGTQVEKRERERHWRGVDAGDIGRTYSIFLLIFVFVYGCMLVCVSSVCESVCT